MKKFNKHDIESILIISLSNIGDVVLTFPVIDIVLDNFPIAATSVVVSPKAAPLLRGNPNLNEVIIFDKHQNFLKTLSWLKELRMKKFELIIDLRNTAIPFFIPTRYRTPLNLGNKKKMHMKDKHVKRLQTVLDYNEYDFPKKCIDLNADIVDSVDDLLGLESSFSKSGYIAIAPGAADPRKRWSEDGFACFSDEIIRKYGLGVVFVGDENDNKIVLNIMKKMSKDALNLCGRTELIQLSEVLKRSKMVLTNDSAPMHLASYLDVPVLAIFGKTDPCLYGPWGTNSKYIKGNDGVNSVACDDVLNAFDIIDGKVVFKP